MSDEIPILSRKMRRAIAAQNGGWGPWQEGTLPEITREQAEAHARHLGVSAEEALRVAQDIRLNERVLLNEVYQVNIRDMGDGEPFGPVVHLSIKRRDKKPVHDWRDLQRIKTEIVGADAEAVEIYPPEDQVVDTANQYHLWVFANGTYRLPFGFRGGRLVNYQSGAGAVQRPLEG